MSFCSYFYSRRISPSKDTSNHVSSVYHTRSRSGRQDYIYSLVVWPSRLHLLAVWPSRDYIYSRDRPSRLHLLARSLAIEITSTRLQSGRQDYIYSRSGRREITSTRGPAVKITSTRSRSGCRDYIYSRSGRQEITSTCSRSGRRDYIYSPFWHSTCMPSSVRPPGHPQIPVLPNNELGLCWRVP